MSKGHNIGELSDKDRRILFAFHHRKDLAIATQMKQLGEEKKANRQLAKSRGFPAAKLDHYLKSLLAEDQQKPVDKHRSERENLEWLGLIPETSGGDLLAQADRATQEQMIAAKGFHAGLTGLDRVSGYDAGSAEDREWLASYDVGRKEYDTELPEIFARIEAMGEAAPADGDDPFADEDAA